VGTTTPNLSAMPDVSNTTRGLLTQRMAAVQRNSRAAQAKRLLMFEPNNMVCIFWNEKLLGKIGAALTGDTLV